MATTYYLRDAASDLAGTGQKAMSTSRGAGSTTAVTNTAASGTNIQVTKTAAGTALTWFTPQLNAVTVQGSVTVNIRGMESSNSANSKAGITVEATGGAGDVTSTVVANTAVPTTSSEYSSSSDGAKNASFTPTSTPLVTGQRIKVTLFVKNQGTMGGGYTVTNTYDGASAGAAGDTYVTFTETLTEGSTKTAAAGVAEATAAGVNPVVTVVVPAQPPVLSAGVAAVSRAAVW